jgi:hypothetical protein
MKIWCSPLVPVLASFFSIDLYSALVSVFGGFSLALFSLLVVLQISFLVLELFLKFLLPSSPLLYLCCANCVVNKNGHVLDDMVPYHAHIYFAWSLLCVGTCGYYWWMRSHEWFQSTTSTTRAYQQIC